MKTTYLRSAKLALLCVVAFSACVSTKAPTSSSHNPINTPGERVELGNHLVAGKTNLFYFYADW